jgi:TRAP-type transport system large permease protein
MTIIVFLGSLLAAMALGIPIAFSLLLCGAALMWHMNMMDAQILAQNIMEGSNSFPLLAVPFFMLAGEVMNTGGLSRRIVDFAMALVGHIRGGLGYVTILAACILSALSGSAVADAAALTALLLPMMVKAGHDKARSGGLIAACGVIGPIIPPSIGFVIFGVAGGVSITKLFLAGIFPGILLAVGLWGTWWWLTRKEDLQPPPRRTRGEVWAAFRRAGWALTLPLIILVGLRMGVFTPTEAAVVAAVFALFVAGVIYKELKWSQLYGGSGHGVRLVDHCGAAACADCHVAATPAGQPQVAHVCHHAAGHGGGHRHGHDPDHFDSHPRTDALGQGRRD